MLVKNYKWIICEEHKKDWLNLSKCVALIKHWLSLPTEFSNKFCLVKSNSAKTSSNISIGGTFNVLVNKSNSAIFKAKIKVLCCPDEPYFLTEILLIRNSTSSRWGPKLHLPDNASIERWFNSCSAIFLLITSSSSSSGLYSVFPKDNLCLFAL